jgi:drug/metabolite transporter (DMT)-like permease
MTGDLFLEEVIDGYTVLGFSVIVVGFALVKRAAIQAELPRLRAAVFGESGE